MRNHNTTERWRGLLIDLIDTGSEVAPVSAGADFKGRASVELIAYQSVWDMRKPVVACPVRNLGYKFMFAEAACILQGDNRLQAILPYAKHMARFSDDQRTLNGHYGPPFVEQAAWVAKTLLADQASRQAVMTIWRPRPGVTKDTPCTVALQWLIRDGELNCVATMRSSDAWTGVPYDVFAFSMMSAYVSLAVRELDRVRAREANEKRLPLTLPLGKLYLTAGSQHLYTADWEDADKAVLSTETPWPQEALDLRSLADPDALIAMLWAVARSTDAKRLATTWNNQGGISL